MFGRFTAVKDENAWTDRRWENEAIYMKHTKKLLLVYQIHPLNIMSIRVKKIYDMEILKQVSVNGLSEQREGWWLSSVKVVLWSVISSRMWVMLGGCDFLGVLRHHSDVGLINLRLLSNLWSICSGPNQWMRILFFAASTSQVNQNVSMKPHSLCSMFKNVRSKFQYLLMSGAVPLWTSVQNSVNFVSLQTLSAI